MRPLRFLHLASFTGNIGDNANHLGFRPWIERLLDGRTVEWTNLEIREFYWRERAWDRDFVDMVNGYDMLIIGGGNYFELWVEGSPTGTSIAIPLDLFVRIRVPVFFNALGVDPGQGVPESARTRFTAFLDTLLGSEQYLVSVRNDGAKANLSEHIGAAYAEAVLHAPDNGFFAAFGCPAENHIIAPDPRRRRVAINVASDMPGVRFSGFKCGNPQAAFACEFARAIEAVADVMPETDFVMMPHIFRDLDVQYQIIANLPDRLRRTRLIVAPFGSGNRAARHVFGLYAMTDMTLGMRFHANVCSIGMQKQTLGLACYPQISALYEELGQSDRILDVSKPGFVWPLVEAVRQALYAPDAFSGSPGEALVSAQALRDDVEPEVQGWLTLHYGA